MTGSRDTLRGHARCRSGLGSAQARGGGPGPRASPGSAGPGRVRARGSSQRSCGAQTSIKHASPVPPTQGEPRERSEAEGADRAAKQ